MVKGEPGTQTEANSLSVPNSTYINVGSTPGLTRMIALSHCSRTSGTIANRAGV